MCRVLHMASDIFEKSGVITNCISVQIRKNISLFEGYIRSKMEMLKFLKYSRNKSSYR